MTTSHLTATIFTTTNKTLNASTLEWTTDNITTFLQEENTTNQPHKNLTQSRGTNNHAPLTKHG